MSGYIRDFQVLGELGLGQYGRVWRAEGLVPGRPGHPARRRQVAIKVLHPDTSPAAIQALAQEWALLDQVKHRAVVRVFAFWPEERAVVMEYVHGVTLRTVLDACNAKKEQVFAEAALDIGCELADALYHAHTALGDNGEPLHIVHRDLKPENIMLTPSGDLRILDFGLAHVRNADFAVENDGLVRGTPVYMAPEQIRGDPIDHRTDLFALGLILYELLIGRPAWCPPVDPTTRLGPFYRRIAEGELSAECRELEQMMPGLGAIVSRLLQPSPRNRYTSGQDLLVDLRRQTYRDRAASLTEFCDFFFGSVHLLPDPVADGDEPMATPPPDPDNVPTTGDVARAVPVRRSTRSVPLAVTSGMMVAPADTGVRAPPRIVQRPTPVASTPNVELPASVRGAPKPTRPKIVGARDPSETGMMTMHPFGHDADNTAAGQDPSATAIFALKAPAPGLNRPSGVSPFQPPPIVAHAPAPAMASAVATANFGPNTSATPFQVAATNVGAPASNESRTRSWEVVALIAAVVMLAFLAVVTLVGLTLYYDSHSAVAVTPPAVAVPIEPLDAPIAEPPPVEPLLPTTSTKAPRPRTPTAAVAPTEPKPPPPAARGTATIHFKSTPAPSSATLDCGDGDARSQRVSGGTVSFTDVPTSGSCTLKPAGIVAYTKYSGIHGGRSYSCTVDGTVTQCN